MAYAAVVNAELRRLKAAGADFVQLDEPYLASVARSAAAPSSAWPLIEPGALEGIEGPTGVHLCFRLRPHGSRQKRERLTPIFARASTMPRHHVFDRGRGSRGLDCAILRALPPRRSSWRASTSATPRSRHRRSWQADQVGAGARAARASGAGAGLRHEISAAERAIGKLEALAPGRASSG